MLKTGEFLKFGGKVESPDQITGEFSQDKFDDDEPPRPNNAIPKPSFANFVQVGTQSSSANSQEKKKPSFANFVQSEAQFSSIEVQENKKPSFANFVKSGTQSSSANSQEKKKPSFANFVQIGAQFSSANFQEKKKPSKPCFANFIQSGAQFSSIEVQEKKKSSFANFTQIGVQSSPAGNQGKPSFASILNSSTNVRRHGNDFQHLNARRNLPNNYVPSGRTREELINEDQKYKILYSNVYTHDEAIRVTGNNGEHVRIGSWTEAGLSNKIITNITTSCYTCPRNIQKTVIPLINSGKSFKAQSETGSGKTCGYLIPLIDRISKAKLKDPSCIQDVCAPLVIIIVVCRELVVQVRENALKLGYNTGVITDMCYGQYSSTDNAKHLKESGTDILISTTERLFDFLYQGIIVLTRLETLVFDDADRLFEGRIYRGFVKEAKMTCKGNLQILLFSATYCESADQLAIEYLGRNHISVINYRANEPNLRIVQTFELISKGQKIKRVSNYCKRIFEEYPGKKLRILIFINECEVAEKVAESLKSDGIKAEAYSSIVDQEDRERFVNDFQKNNLQILVASDVSAYGIDVKGLDHVLLYDLPRFHPAFLTYVQRIGRTGRLSQGYAHSFYDPATDKEIRNEIIFRYQSGKAGNITNPEVLLKN